MTLRRDIALGMRWTTEEKLMRCGSADELEGFMNGLRDQNAATPELRIEAEKLAQRWGWVLPKS